MKCGDRELGRVTPLLLHEVGIGTVTGGERNLDIVRTVLMCGWLWVGAGDGRVWDGEAEKG